MMANTEMISTLERLLELEKVNLKQTENIRDITEILQLQNAEINMLRANLDTVNARVVKLESTIGRRIKKIFTDIVSKL